MDGLVHINQLAHDVLILSRNTLLVNLRFLDRALSQFQYIPYTETVCTDGQKLFYNPSYVLKQYKEDMNMCSRIYLHIVFHCVYRHMFVDNVINQDLWDLACDISVENTIFELSIENLKLSQDIDMKNEIINLKQNIKIITAEKIYRYLQDNSFKKEHINRLKELFQKDDHSIWYQYNLSSNLPFQFNQSYAATSDVNSKNDSSERNELEQIWKNISERMQIDLEHFTKENGKNRENLIQNLSALNREKYDYSSFLKKFAVMGEVMKINDDEFDYIFYTYGLNLYGKMPLIEPLEYKEEKRIKEFVIAIDTSGSVSGKLVQKFLNKTYNILKSTESFFTRVNIHIIQCDTDIHEDAKITSQEEFDQYIEVMKLHGFGGTDFRPVFKYVDNLIESKEFENLKGLIYFTDGMGVYPQKKPDYHVAFVYIDDEYNDYNVPSWAIKVILESEDIKRFK